MTDESAETKQWRHRTDERVTLLTQGETVQNDRLDAMQEQIRELEELVEGDPHDKHDNGLKGEVVDLDRKINELRAIIMPDSLGHGGFRQRLTAVEQRLKLDIRGSDNRWKFAQVVAGATVTAMAAIIAALLAIEPVRNAVGQWFDSHVVVSKKVKKRPVRMKVRRAVEAPPGPGENGVSERRSEHGGNVE